MKSVNVYIKARGVVREVALLLPLVKRHDRGLADQLRRAAQSVVLNIAEARGSDAGNARARFATACGSAKEVRAALHLASDWGYLETRNAHHLDRRLDEVWSSPGFIDRLWLSGKDADHVPNASTL